MEQWLLSQGLSGIVILGLAWGYRQERARVDDVQDGRLADQREFHKAVLDLSKEMARSLDAAIDALEAKR